VCCVSEGVGLAAVRYSSSELSSKSRVASGCSLISMDNLDGLAGGLAVRRLGGYVWT
jgi:hypothetical protein